MTVTLSTLTSLAVPAGLASAGLLLGLVLRRTVLARLARAAARTRSKADDVVVAALRGPVVLWCAVLGLYLGVQLGEAPPALGRVVEPGLVALLIVSTS